jgi:hypothetical protein
MPSCIKVTFRSIIVNPISRDRSLAMDMRRCRLWWMAEWSEDYVAAIGSFKLEPWNLGI